MIQFFRSLAAVRFALPSKLGAKRHRRIQWWNHYIIQAASPYDSM